MKLNKNNKVDNSLLRNTLKTQLLEYAENATAKRNKTRFLNLNQDKQTVKKQNCDKGQMLTRVINLERIGGDCCLVKSYY